MAPVRCVVDANVAVVANGRSADDASCAAASARALGDVMKRGHLFIDAAGDIVTEYRNNLSPYGQQLPGNVFLKWLLTNEWNPSKVTKVTLTPKDADPTDFDELPRPPDGVSYDPSDRKYLAVAAAHPEHPPILQALDSKWWGWREALASSGVTVHFLCPDEVEAKHRSKMGA